MEESWPCARVRRRTFFGAGFGFGFGGAFFTTFFLGATLRFGAALRAPMYTAGDAAAAERTATCDATGAWKPAAHAARQNSRIARSIMSDAFRGWDSVLSARSRATARGERAQET